jgi:hypothetical protein
MSSYDIIHEATSALVAEAARTNVRSGSRDLDESHHPAIIILDMHERPRIQTYQMPNAQLTSQSGFWNKGVMPMAAGSNDAYGLSNRFPILARQVQITHRQPLESGHHAMRKCFCSKTGNERLSADLTSPL